MAASCLQASRAGAGTKTLLVFQDDPFSLQNEEASPPTGAGAESSLEPLVIAASFLRDQSPETKTAANAAGPVVIRWIILSTLSLGSCLQPLAFFEQTRTWRGRHFDAATHDALLRIMLTSTEVKIS